LLEHNNPAAFDALLCELSAAAAHNRQSLVDAWTSRHGVSPLVGDDEAIIWYTGEARQVVLRGDMLGERSQVLQRVPNTRLWFDRRRYEPDARLDYHLLADGRDVGDPRNPRPAPSRYGPRAELRMPQFHDAELWRPRPGVAKGKLTQHTVASSLYPSTRRVVIYTPAEYEPRQRYPSVLFHDGGDYLDLAGAATILDNLHARRAIPPCVAVFVDPSVEHGRVVDYDLNQAYAGSICDELLPWLAKRVSTSDDPARRATVGASLGGLIALYIAVQRPDRFGLVAAQSAYAGRSGDSIIQLYRRAQQLPLRVHQIVGTYETEVGSLERGPAEADFVRANRALRDVLRERSAAAGYAEYHDGHAWGLWRARLGDALRFLFG